MLNLPLISYNNKFCVLLIEACNLLPAALLPLGKQLDLFTPRGDVTFGGSCPNLCVG